VSVFYEVKVHICGIILVLDGPWDGVGGGGQLGRVIDEGLDDCGFEIFEGSNDGHERQNIRLTAVRACSNEAEMTRIRLSRSSDIKVDLYKVRRWFDLISSRAFSVIFIAQSH
jgi:hypothetical protein